MSFRVNDHSAAAASATAGLFDKLAAVSEEELIQGQRLHVPRLSVKTSRFSAK